MYFESKLQAAIFRVRLSDGRFCRDKLTVRLCDDEPRTAAQEWRLVTGGSAIGYVGAGKIVKVVGSSCEEMVGERGYLARLRYSRGRRCAIQQGQQIQAVVFWMPVVCMRFELYAELNRSNKEMMVERCSSSINERRHFALSFLPAFLPRFRQSPPRAAFQHHWHDMRSSHYRTTDHQ